MSVQKFKRFLSEKNQAELMKELSELYKQLHTVRDYYALRMDDATKQDVLTKFKQTILQEFFPKRGLPNARLSVARKAVMDFKKLNGSSVELVDLALYYVEVGVQFTNAYGDIDESFYNSMETMYLNALKWGDKLQLLQAYQARFLSIVNQTTNIGWGFHDGLLESYEQYF